MNVMHTTADGRRMFIAQMEDEHLFNTIKLLIGQLDGALGFITSNPEADRRRAAIYGVNPKQVEAHAYKEVPRLSRFLAPYLAEMLLRDMDPEREVVRDMLRATFGRDGRDDVTTPLFSSGGRARARKLPPGGWTEPEDLDDDILDEIDD